MCLCVSVWEVGGGERGGGELRVIVFIVILVVVRHGGCGRRHAQHGGVGGEGYGALRLCWSHAAH